MPRPEGKWITIFYGSGTKAHNSDFNELVGPALIAAMERYYNVRLIIVGHLELRPEFALFSERILRFDFMRDLDQYWSLLASSDINIAVLRRGAMADCKSEIKWLEAAVLQIPSIVSGTANISRVLEDNVNALIVDCVDEWIDALNRLITSVPLRRSIGSAARRKALRDYSLQYTANILVGEFQRSSTKVVNTDDGTSTTKRKIKLLICNVFFAPRVSGALRGSFKIM